MTPPRPPSVTPRPRRSRRGGATRVLAALALSIVPVLPTPAALTAQEAVPDGWEIRTDRPNADATEITFVDMPPGWHVTTGPAAILFDPEMTAEGAFRVEMEVFLFDPEGRREAFGFFVGGEDLQGPGQDYLYFLIRDGGEFLVKHRSGSDTHTLVNWTSDSAILGYADRDEGGSSVRNVLALDAGTSTVRFLVNGEEVATLPRDEVNLDGVVGLRVNHALNLHVSRFEISREE